MGQGRGSFVSETLAMHRIWGLEGLTVDAGLRSGARSRYPASEILQALDYS